MSYKSKNIKENKNYKGIKEFASIFRENYRSANKKRTLYFPHYNINYLREIFLCWMIKETNF